MSDAVKIVLDEAETARVAAIGKPWTYGGSSPTEGFDCSGFVIYVFNQAYGPNTVQRVSADALRTGGLFPPVPAPGAAGDLVFFKSSPAATPPNSDTPAHHVGIVVNSERWIGCQGSEQNVGGVAYVNFSNTYWKPRILSYGRFPQQTVANAIIPWRAGSYASIINPKA